MTKKKGPETATPKEPRKSGDIIAVLKERFEAHEERHANIAWGDVQAKLTKGAKKVATLREMEETGGEPDVVGFDKKSGDFIFMDCSKETPSGRRSLCYDRKALGVRKEHKPKGSAMELAAKMGIELLTEAEYRELQKLGSFDTTTSSWLKTPDAIRALGGAIFGDYRYGQVFVYHNGAESYYSARGFRGVLRV